MTQYSIEENPKANVTNRNIFSIFKKEIIFVRDNISLLALVFPILGGIWQIITLLSIDITFVRFFSTSQVIPDGILLFIGFLMLYLIYNLKKIYFDKIILRTHLTDRNINNYIRVISIGIIVGTVGLLNFLGEISGLIPYMDKPLSLIFIYLVFYILILGFVKDSLQASILLYRDINLSGSIQKINKVFAVIILILTNIIYIGICLASISFVNDAFDKIKFPQNLLNSELLNKNIKDEYKLKDNPTLIGFNKDYLFYEINSGNDKSKIIILDTKKLIEVENHN